MLGSQWLIRLKIAARFNACLECIYSNTIVGKIYLVRSDIGDSHTIETDISGAQTSGNSEECGLLPTIQGIVFVCSIGEQCLLCRTQLIEGCGYFAIFLDL